MSSSNTAKQQKLTKVWGNYSISLSTCIFWFKSLHDEDFSLEHLEHHGRPAELDDQALKDLVKSGTSHAVHEMAMTLEVSKVTIRRHLEAIGKTKKKKKKLQKWIPIISRYV